MKKTIKNIIIFMAVAMLFISCNADLATYGKGIFESMMTSAPNADYTIKRFAGKHGDNFLIETEAGIASLSKTGNKTTLVEELHPEIAFTLDNDLYYKVKNENKADFILKKVSFDNLETKTVVTIKNGEDTLYLQKSFYEDGSYVLLLVDNAGKTYIGNSNNASLADNVITITGLHTCKLRAEGTPNDITYIGEGYYRVKYESAYDVFNIDGKEIKLGDKAFTSLPMAVENGYLFLQDGSICKIADTTATAIENQKHSVGYLQSNHDVPMVTNGSTIYGCYGAKPFTFDGTNYADHEAIGSGVVIIDLVYDGGVYYAFSAENGLYFSEDGKSYKRVNAN